LRAHRLKMKEAPHVIGEGVIMAALSSFLGARKVELPGHFY
jgi:hypothetical protein